MESTFPKELRIENTNLCNAACFMCPREKLSRPKGVMSLADFKRIIDEVASHKPAHIDLHGFGEPLLDRQLVEKIAYAKAAGMPRVGFITNGSILNRKLAERILNSSLDYLRISLYGNTAKEYEDIHRQLKFSVTFNNILELLKLRAKMRQRHLHVKVRGLGIFNYLLALEVRYGFFISHRLLTIYFHARAIFAKYFGAAAIKWHNYGDGRAFNDSPGTTPTPMRCKLINDDVMTVMWTGQAVSCVRDYDGKSDFGNILEHGLASVWNSTQYQKFRTDMKADNASLYPYCAQCDNRVPVENVH